MSEAEDALAASTVALQDEVAGLRVQVSRLNERADGLREDVGNLSDRTSRNEGRIALTAIALVIAVMLVVGVGVTAWRGYLTDRRLDAICPVLALVIGGYDPSTRPAGDARNKYVASFDVMRTAYRDLGCTQPLVPPRSTS